MGGCQSCKKNEEPQIATNFALENEKRFFANPIISDNTDRDSIEAKIRLFDDQSIFQEEYSSIIEYEYLPTSSKSPDRAKDPARSSLDIIALSIQKNYRKCEQIPKI